MTDQQYIKDLVILVADKNMEFALKGILSRYHSMKIRDITREIYVHPEKDPGCLLRGHLFMRPFVNRFAHALVLLDRVGSGQERSARDELEIEIDKRLSSSGWGDRASAVVIEPELDIWVWSDSPQVDIILGWGGRHPALRDWLHDNGYLQQGKFKPERPKEAMGCALKVIRQPRSSSLYLKLAEKVGLDRCADPSFVKLKTILQKWFAIK